MELPNLLLTLFFILVTAKIFGEAAHRLGQSPVVGELIGGVLIGTSVLNLVHESVTLHALAEIGAIVLLFEVGVRSNLYEFLKVGIWALLVAIVGVALPFAMGYGVSLYFGIENVHAIFIGAILTATSVGITARVLSDLKKLNSDEAKIILGAAVIDDVIGLAILAVTTKLVETGCISIENIGVIAAQAVGFLVFSMVLGTIFAPALFDIIKKLRVNGALTVGAFAFCLLASYFASLVGLAPIVGAFTAGLILSVTDSKEKIAVNITPVSEIFVPIFFVLMGALVNVNVFNPFVAANITILQISGMLFIAAVIGKVVSGYAVFKPGIDRLLIGTGMIPRGEVGLIFASIGLSHHIINQQIYSAAVVVIIATTFVTPLLLQGLIKKRVRT